MVKIGEKLVAFKIDVRNDVTLRRAKQLFHGGTCALPAASLRYLLDKVPVVQWIPKYSPSWLINDAISGLTIGVILVPQGLAYAKIADISLECGLLASWLPSILYFIMGTSKDVNTGPTSIIGLLTAEIISAYNKTYSDSDHTPAAIATAIALSVGIYSLILGLLKLGFLLELVSIPVLTGYISAAALTVIVGQAPVIFGMELKGTVANKIRETFMSLPKTRGFDFAVGSISMVLLIGIQILGRRYGKTSKIAWIVSVGRNAIVIILASIVAFLAHPKHEQGESPTAFALTGTIPPGLRTSKAPDMTLVGRILPNAITVFVAAALEHFAVAKSFGRKNGYTIDQSQELTFLGFTNLFNSFLGGMAVSGAASRTAVNSESGVKSPLGGLFTAATVLISLYGLTGALYWIPKATLSAIIIVAVWSIIVPVSVFYGFWKVSFVDFLASQIAFWVTLFHSTQCGIMSATAFTLFITILRMMFSRGAVVRAGDVQRSYAGDGADDGAAGLGLQVGLETPPEGYQIIRFTTPIVFLNAAQTKASILHGVQTFHTGREIALEGADPNRLWNGLTARDVALLRKKAGLSAQDVELLPPIRVVVLDLERVMYVDTTGFRALEDAIAELEVYGGREAEVRIVGLRGELVGKLERSGVKLRKDDGENEGVLLFDGMEDALRAAIAPSEKKEQSALESESGVLEV